MDCSALGFPVLQYLLEFAQTNVHWAFLGGSDSKEPTCKVGDLSLIPGLGRFPGGGHGNPLQYSCLENPHGQRSLGGCSPWGHKETDRTEWLSTTSIKLVMPFNHLILCHRFLLLLSIRLIP